MSSDLKMTLGWVIAYVDDPAAAAEFYERSFSMRTDFRGAGRVCAAGHGLDEARLCGLCAWREELRRRGSPRGEQASRPNMEIALLHADVEAAYARALEAGCESLAPPRDKPQGQRVAYVRDPFGTLVELATPL